MSPGSHLDRNGNAATAERDSSGPIKGKICRDSTDFYQLTSPTNPWVQFSRDDPGKEDEDHLMQPSVAEPLDRLARFAACENIPLIVTEAYDSDGEHSGRALHYEGRAVDLDTPKVADRERVAYLAHLAGFDWVKHEGNHVHASAQGAHAQQDTNCACSLALPDANGHDQGVVRAFGYPAGGCLSAEPIIPPTCPRGGTHLDYGDNYCSQNLLFVVCCGYADQDTDGLPDPFDPNPLDDDTDDDGLFDGNRGSEDLNTNGVVDPGETDPTKFDTDGDGISDGVERGLVAPEGNGTNLTVFVPDADPTTVSDPLQRDTDGDGVADGQEDVNGNGSVDAGESSPLAADTDGDSVPDGTDTCPLLPNPDQADLDGNHIGDACETAFRRADSNGDENVNLSDAINTLAFLFLGTGQVSCQDAADANDDGVLNISDAVRVLEWLFSDPTQSPPAPGPLTLGLDPTSDSLTCSQYP